MYVRILQTFIEGHGAIAIGSLIDVPEDKATQWITNGLAKAAITPPKIERAVKTPRNKALAPQANPSDE